jgi:hypothetical protein
MSSWQQKVINLLQNVDEVGKVRMLRRSLKESLVTGEILELKN